MPTLVARGPAPDRKFALGRIRTVSTPSSSREYPTASAQTSAIQTESLDNAIAVSELRPHQQYLHPSIHLRSATEVSA